MHTTSRSFLVLVLDLSALAFFPGAAASQVLSGSVLLADSPGGKSCLAGRRSALITENPGDGVPRSYGRALVGAISDCTDDLPEIRPPVPAARGVPESARAVSSSSKSSGELVPYAGSDLPDGAAVDLHIAAAREAVVELLASENACSTWFRQADPDIVATFQSLKFQIEQTGSQRVIREVGDRGNWMDRGPYIARTSENTGAGSTIVLNANGAFFRARGRVYRVNWPGQTPLDTGNLRNIHVGPYDGGTLRAQILALLHELAHVVGTIPEDASAKFGVDVSVQNTETVLRFCKAATELSAKQSVLILLQRPRN